MQRAMDRLSALLHGHRTLVLVVWAALLAAAIPFTLRQTENLSSGGFQVPGSGAEAVDKQLDEFPGAQAEYLSVVLVRRGGDAADVRRQVGRVERAAKELKHVRLDSEIADEARASAGGGRTTIVPLEVTGNSRQAMDMAADVREELAIGAGPRQGVEPYIVGQAALWTGMQEVAREDLESAEKTGFPIVLVVLLVVFGSLAAAALPLALGFVSVALTGAAIFFLSQETEMSVFVTNISSMVGIGVAVDYSLFVLARYREEIHAGREPHEARRVAMRTSGLAVAFSGITVMLSLAGLFLVESTTIRSMATGAIIVVGVSILAATTLLPALIGLLGRRAYARSRLWTITGLLARSVRNRRRRRGSTTEEPRPGFWRRWTDTVMRHPIIAIVGSSSVLLALAYPATQLEWGDGALRQFPDGNETLKGANVAAEELGEGAAGPLQIVAELRPGKGSFDSPRNQSRLQQYVATRAKNWEIVGVAPPVLSHDRRSALIVAQPRHDPESQKARGLLDQLREHARSDQGLARAARIEVGGATARVEDFKDLVSGSMWKILLFVMAFSYLVLFVLLRSVWLPLKAVLVNLLSVGAAYGVLVMVFQYGWLDGLLGWESLGYVNTMTPPFLLAIVFGLSMDYEVFLLTRIRERWDATGDNRRSVAEGLAASARTISSAALIMVAVFLVFAGTGVPSIREVGVGMSVAIALDATLVRLILVPAMMEVMGRWNWWMPGFLGRVLPRADFESTGAADRAPA